MPTIVELLNTAVAHHRAGRLGEADRIYRHVLELEPNNFDALQASGVLAHQIGRHELAIESISRAIAMQPQIPDLYQNLGAVYRALSRNEEAIATFERAVQLAPNNPQPHCGIGNACKMIGRTEDAIRSYRKAIELDPRHASAYFGLGELVAHQSCEFTDSELKQLKELSEDSSVKSQDRSVFHFTLADVNHTQQNYDEAFQHYQRGNDLKLEAAKGTYLDYDESAHIRLFEELKTTFDRDFFANQGEIGSDSQQPIFVVGMPRSGTPLVEQIIASHPLVFGGGELKYVNQVAVDLTKRLDTESHFPISFQFVTPDLVREFADFYLQKTRKLDEQATHILDKMPANILFLGVIALLFPRSKVIHCKRDPIDTCFSCYCNNLKDAYSNRLDTLGRYYLQYQSLMDHWHEHLPLDIHDVQYEDLVADQANVSRKLIAACGLEWNEQCLNFYNNPRAVKTASKLQVRKPIYSSSIGRWKNMSPICLLFAQSSTVLPERLPPEPRVRGGPTESPAPVPILTSE